jgi:serine/threonine protein kinase
VCVQVAAGLEGAHETGIVHRDLKPANVRVREDGVVKVLDFGLAKPEQEVRALLGDNDETMSMAPTAEGRIMGTAGYMSPEQARGKNVDKRADIWSFGTVLFECLTGHRAFKGETPMDALVAILEKEPPWELLPPKTPEPIRALLTRCLEKDARKRLRDIGDARIDLEDLLRSPRTLSISRAELQPDVLRIQKPLLRAETEEQASSSVGSAMGSGGTFGSAHESRLPADILEFRGRDGDLTRIGEMLGEARLVTLTGSGGCGKSRLAIEVARRFGGAVPR